MADPTSFFTTAYEAGFGTYTEADDLLHPAMNAKVADYTCSETQYLGFNVPEYDISAIGYLWHHPKMQTVYGGTVALRGIKRQITAAEMVDLRCYMSDSVLAGDLHDVRLDSGYRTQVIEPGRRFRISYEDPERENRYDVELTAIMPPVMWPTGRHFEQAMRTKGELVLRGERIPVDGYFVRDRTWGEARTEAAPPIPATSWMTGVFDDDFAFSANVIDDPARNPIWADRFTVDPDHLVLGGWIWKDGRVAALRSASKLNTYDRDTMVPRTIDMRIEDSEGREFEIHGEVRSAFPWNAWHNVHGPCGVTRWELDGRTGYGDLLEVQWNDFVSAYMNPGRTEESR